MKRGGVSVPSFTLWAEWAEWGSVSAGWSRGEALCGLLYASPLVELVCRAIAQGKPLLLGDFLIDFWPICSSIHILPSYYYHLHPKTRQTPAPSFAQSASVSSNVVITQTSFVIIAFVCAQVWLKCLEWDNHWPKSDWIVMETLRGRHKERCFEEGKQRRKRIKGRG